MLQGYDWEWDEVTGEYVEVPIYGTVLEVEEVWIYTDPLDSDSDDDLLPDSFEVFTVLLDPNDPSDGNSDVDQDLLTRGQEYEIGTSHFVDDHDSDGHLDGMEVLFLESDPLDAGDPPAEPGNSGGDSGDHEANEQEETTTDSGGTENGAENEIDPGAPKEENPTTDPATGAEDANPSAPVGQTVEVTLFGISSGVSEPRIFRFSIQGTRTR